MFLLHFSLLLLPSFSLAYTFKFTSIPTQCETLSLSVDGSGGQPPYSVVLIPYGASTLPNNIEARRITTQNFTGTDTSVSFQLKFPSNTQFVAVVSDASGFGSGGTSGAVTVQASNNASCYDATQNVAPLFAFSIVPGGQITQCTPTRIWWDPAVVTGNPTFQGVIPGGQSFAIPQSNLTTVAEQGLGFTWTPNVRAYTNMILVGGDGRGIGTAGSAPYTINPGDNTCLSDVSPSSTAGSPAGGAYPTSTDGAGTGSGGSSGGGTNVGAIVGGVIGGLVLLAAILLLALFFYRRRNFHKSQKERPVDLFRDEDHDEQDALANTQLPPHYQPEPFLARDPTVLSDSDGDDMVNRRHSAYTSVSGYGGGGLGVGGVAQGGSVSGRSQTPTSMGTSTYFRKSPAPPSFRPVNIVQHEDAGPSDDPNTQGDLETIELPPAYTNLRVTPASTPADSSAATNTPRATGASTPAAAPGPRVSTTSAHTDRTSDVPLSALTAATALERLEAMDADQRT